MLKKDRINIEAGDMTYGQRIELGQIIDAHNKSEDHPVDLVKKLITCLHKKCPRFTVANIKGYIEYSEEILKGIKSWVDREQLSLHYDPTAEEISAGIRDLSKKIGDFGTIKALAKTYGQDPDEVLKWKYGKVFGLLYTDLEEHKYQVKYNKKIQEKYKSKST